MDALTFIGLVVGLGAIVLGQFLEGGTLSSLSNMPALIIVIGGTLGATMLQTPWYLFVRAIKLVPWVFKPPNLEMTSGIHKVKRWAQSARREGLLGLESEIDNENDKFVTKGLQLLIDGIEPEQLRNILELDILAKENFDIKAAKVFESMGGYSPTIGILGAVMGLIHVMENLADPAMLGAGIAVAFVATIYGVGFANLVFLPMSQKLKEQVHSQSHYREMLLEGLISIGSGENPENIEVKLSSFIH